MTRATVAWAAMAVLAGCGGGAGGAGGASRPPAWLSDPADPVAGAVRELARRMEEAGLAVGDPSGGGFLTNRDERTFAITVAPEKCVTIVALGSRGVRDLDATLHAPSGDVLAEDVEPDAHPTLQACAGPRPRTLYYSLVAYDGAGSFHYVSFAGDRASLDRAAGIVGGQPGLAADADESGTDDVRLREATSGLRRRGFRPDGATLAVPLSREQRVRVPVPVERGRCYTVVALAATAVEDVDAILLDELGRELARDVSPARDAQVQYCADRTADLAVEVHAASGQGRADVAVFAGDEADVGGVAGLWLGERTAGAPSAIPLEEVVRTELARATANGWTGATRTASGRIGGGEVRAHDLVLAGGRCSLVVVAGGRGAGRLALRVLDAEGRPLADRFGDGQAATVRLCPTSGAHVTAELIARRGRGDYEVHVLEKSVPQDLGSDVADDDRGAVLDALEDGATRGLALARRSTHRAALRAERLDTRGCAVVRVIAAGVGGAVDARLVRGDEIVDRGAGRTVELSACRRDGGAPLTLSVDPVEGTPAFHVVVMTAPR